MEREQNTVTVNQTNEHNDRFIVHELFSTEQSVVEPIKLLPNLNRVACSAHMLDKLGKIDALNALDDIDFANMHKKVFDKLETIWNIKNSRLCSEVFHRITGRKIIGPHKIRWSKTFDAVSTQYTYTCCIHFNLYLLFAVFIFNVKF